MSQPKERKRWKITGRGAKPQYLGIEQRIVNSPEFKKLRGGPLRALLHLGVQYNGYNNGNFYVKPLREHINKKTLEVSIQKLQASGWIVKTRFGGLGMGPDLFAITWWPIDECKGKHDYPAETVASHTWMTNRPPYKVGQAVLESRTEKLEKEPIVQVPVLESRTKNPNFRAA